MTGAVWGLTLFLFAAGLVLVVLRRRLIAMLLGLELMICAVNVSIVYHAGLFSDPEALAAMLLIIAVAAAEAVVGLSLILRVYQSGRPADAGRLQELSG